LAQTGILEATAAFITPLPLFGAVLSPGTPLLGTLPIPIGLDGMEPPMPGMAEGAGMLLPPPNMLGAGAVGCCWGAGTWATGAATRCTGATGSFLGMWDLTSTPPATAPNALGLAEVAPAGGQVWG